MFQLSLLLLCFCHRFPPFPFFIVHFAFVNFTSFLVSLLELRHSCHQELINEYDNLLEQHALLL